MKFESEIRDLGPVTLPAYAGIRVMMMPFRVDDMGTIPDSMASWRDFIADMLGHAPGCEGVGYLTIDEAEVEAGQTHRRPGPHVDLPPWTSPKSLAERGGMFVASNVTGCRAWPQTFDGAPADEGDCAHLADQCDPARETLIQGGRAYWLNSNAVHETLSLSETTRRQFVRVSMPSDAPWFEGYTPNPLGVLPGGPILPARHDFMAYRPTT